MSALLCFTDHRLAIGSNRVKGSILIFFIYFCLALLT